MFSSRAQQRGRTYMWRAWMWKPQLLSLIHIFPYYIGDVITDPEELTLQTPESFFKRFRINMKIHHEVISIHPERKTVSVKNLENGEIFEEKYDKLILSPGVKPTQPRLPGVGIDKLFTLRTVEDTFRIKEYINKNHPKSAVLAGGGFIGLELAENLRELGMDVTIVQRPKQLMNPFDPDMACLLYTSMPFAIKSWSKRIKA